MEVYILVDKNNKVYPNVMSFEYGAVKERKTQIEEVTGFKLFIKEAILKI